MGRSLIITNIEIHLPAMLVLWLGRWVTWGHNYRSKYGMTGSSQDWIPDLDDKLGNHFGDKSMIPENATLFAISQLGKNLCLNIRENSM
ncbi:hypothetical protein AVEN_27207-1 [Araneus ventricosus]|uniref:Uncharacterized protein n=1 Tax=Araneus ventricosus TaxID=182803 RepID=A0A4Y2FHS5_ARAVE|nr:hypothetical protein AVEN_27207-1 [Araneus ventricosus]